MYVYAGNNSVTYTDPDGNIAISLALFAATVVGFLYFQTPAGQQGLQAIEDILYFGCYGAALGCYGIAKTIETVVSIVNSKVEERSIAKAIEKSGEKTSNGQLMYHYTTVSPDKWRGPLRPGSYITPDGNYSGKEADNKLALPKDKDGNDRIPTYKYTFKVKEGEYTSAPNSLPGNIVAPLDGKDGGGTEYISTVPLSPINCEPIE